MKNRDGSYHADFGKDAFATLEFAYRANRKQTLTIRLGEKLTEGKIDRNPGGTIRFQEVKLDVNPERQNYRIELVPDQRNTNSRAIALPDSFPVLMPFRYSAVIILMGRGKEFPMRRMPT